MRFVYSPGKLNLHNLLFLIALGWSSGFMRYIDLPCTINLHNLLFLITLAWLKASTYRKRAWSEIRTIALYTGRSDRTCGMSTRQVSLIYTIYWFNVPRWDGLVVCVSVFHAVCILARYDSSTHFIVSDCVGMV